MARRQPHRRAAGGWERSEDSKRRAHSRAFAHAGEGDLIARLERLEATVAAIAARLGVASGRPPMRRAARERAPIRQGGGVRRQETPGEPHAVIRTVARGLLGRVKQYHPSRGFGFAVGPDAPDDVFFHRSDCRVDPAALTPGAEVVFDLVEMANGQLKAVGLAPVAGRASRRAERPAGAAPSS